MIHIIQLTFILITGVAREPIMQSENRIHLNLYWDAQTKVDE